MTTEHRTSARPALLLGLAILATIPPAVAQRPPTPPGGKGHEQGALDPASKVVDDVAIPTPGALTPQTTARAFVESFLVGLAQRTPSVVHETYLAPHLRQVMPLEQFVADLRDLRAAAGPMSRMSVTYLRQRNATREGEIDGGWATYLGAFERDPRVAFRVDFERGEVGLWQVTSFTIDSPQLERLRKARAAAGSAGSAPATGEAPAEPPAKEPPASAESGGGR